MTWQCSRFHTAPTFLFPPPGSDSDNNMIIVDAKYDEHVLVHVIKTKGDDVRVVNKLYGRLLLSLSFPVVLQLADSLENSANCLSFYKSYPENPC